jgi:glycosyltransferase involved in cell wall biosynthesis
MTEIPAISIIIPLHNKGSFINETLESVASQTLLNWEVIVVENGSTDEGPESAATWVERDERIQMLTAPAPIRGPGAARNCGLDQARGDWVLFLDADDLIKPDYLSSLLQCAEENPGAAIIASRWLESPADGWGADEPAIKEPMGWSSGGHGLENGAIAFTCWAVHSAIVKREWLLPRRWPEELDRYLAEDTAFWFRVIRGATVAYSPALGAVYRTQTENCRTNFHSATWFEGSHRAVQCNLQLLREQQAVPSTMQIESLIRLYSDLYRRALNAKDSSTANLALTEATVWLRRRFENGERGTRSMVFRQLLGIRLFEALKSACKALPFS